MCACRIRRRLTMSVICMRERSSLRLRLRGEDADLALLHVGGDRRPAGRRAAAAPRPRARTPCTARRPPRSRATRLAAMSRQASSVITRHPLVRLDVAGRRESRCARRAAVRVERVIIAWLLVIVSVRARRLTARVSVSFDHVVDDLLQVCPVSCEDLAAGGRRRCRARGSGRTYSTSSRLPSSSTTSSTNSRYLEHQLALGHFASRLPKSMSLPSMP